MREQTTTLLSATSTQPVGVEQPIRSARPPLKHTRRWRLWRTLLVIGGMVICAHMVPALTLTLFPSVSALVVYNLARWVSPEPFLWKIALLNLVLGTLICIGLYLLSNPQYAFLSSSILEPGFWKFAGDATFYHRVGSQIAESLRHQVPFPGVNAQYGRNYHVFVGLIYWAFGTNLLTAILFNVMLAAITVILIFGIVESISDTEAAKWAALLSALWPSGLLWSSQLLKDGPTVFLLATVLYLVIRQTSDVHLGRRLVVHALSLLGLYVSALTLFFFRDYLPVTLAAALAVAAVFLGIRRSLTRRLMLQSGLTLMVLGSSLVYAHRAPLNFLMAVFSPRPYSLKHFNAGIADERLGRWDQAAREYQRAIDLKEDFWPAYYQLGCLMIHQGKYERASHALKRFLELNPEDFSAQVIQDMIHQIEVTLRQKDDVPLLPQTLSTSSAASREKSISSFQTLQEKLDNDIAHFNPVTGRWVGADTPLADEGPLLSASNQRKPPPVASSHELHPAEKRSIVSSQRYEPRKSLSRVMIEEIAIHRRGFITTGGRTLLTRELPDVQGTTIIDITRWVAQAIPLTLFAPYPWQLFGAPKSAVVLTIATGFDSFLILFLSFAAWSGAKKLMLSKYPGGIMIVPLFLALVIIIGTEVVNGGTLYRVRLPVIMLFWILAGVGMTTHPLLPLLRRWGVYRRPTTSAGRRELTLHPLWPIK